MTENQEVATREQKAPLALGGKVGAIVPQNIEQVFRLSQVICAADMAPKAYRRDPNAVMVGIMHGMEIGLTPMAALQSIAVINGMPTIWGDGALGLVRSSGLLEDFDEQITGEGDKMEATCVCHRKGQKSEIRRTFSVGDAKKANLWGKQGPWTQYPQRMLKMRARSWALRDGFADVLRGLSVAEEVRDMEELQQMADGSWKPASRPLREHYRMQAEQRQAEADEARMNQEFRGATDQPIHDDETDSAPADATAGEATEQGPEAAAGGAPGDGPPSPAPEREAADSVGDNLDQQNKTYAGLLKQMGAKATSDELEKWAQDKATLRAVQSLPGHLRTEYSLKIHEAFEAFAAVA